MAKGIYVRTEKHKKQFASIWKGRKRTDSQKQLLSEITKELWKNPEYRSKVLSLNPGMTGRKHSEITKIKISKSERGDKCHSWKGGISFEPYSLDWTKQLRESIRNRDNYLCKICGKSEETREISVHHIDYNKMNCDPGNLITLCMRCHSKTHHDRDYWKSFFGIV